MSTGSDMKCRTGPAIHCPACLEEIPTGEDLFVRCFSVSATFIHNISGLAVNFILIESLQRFYQYYGDEVQVECPTGSGEYMNLLGVAEEIQHRIIHIFGRDMHGRRATNGGNEKLDNDPHFRDYIWFHEVRCGGCPLTFKF